MAVLSLAENLEESLQYTLRSGVSSFILASQQSEREKRSFFLHVLQMEESLAGSFGLMSHNKTPDKTWLVGLGREGRA